MRKINNIVIHHTASPGHTTDMAKVTGWHKERGFKTIGYHYFIPVTGEALVGRPISQIGAHVAGKNNDSIGICLAGNFEVEQPTPAQLGSLEILLINLFEQFPEAKLIGHCDIGITLCPGKSLRKIVWQLKEKYDK
jgi:N-acetylmuramoyl-L-alanine amidase